MYLHTVASFNVQWKVKPTTEKKKDLYKKMSEYLGSAVVADIFIKLFG